jgi:hypothetical protein
LGRSAAASSQRLQIEIGPPGCAVSTNRTHSCRIRSACRTGVFTRKALARSRTRAGLAPGVRR